MAGVNWVCGFGFEVGLYNTQGTVFTENGTPSATVSGAAARTGSYGLNLKATAERTGVSINGNATSTPICGAYVRFQSLPTADQPILSSGSAAGRVGISYHQSTGKFRTYLTDDAANDYGADGTVTVQTGVWYALQFKAISSGTAQVEAYVDDEALGTVTESTANPAAVPAGIDLMITGGTTFGTSTWDVDFDDCFLYNAGASVYQPFPLPSWQMEAKFPTGDGTHVNAANFSDEVPNSPPAAVFSRLDDTGASFIAGTDYVWKDTAGASTDYLEVTFTASTALTGVPIGVMVLIGSEHTGAGDDIVGGGHQIADPTGTGDTAQMGSTVIVNAAGEYQEIDTQAFNSGTGEGHTNWKNYVLRLYRSTDITPQHNIHGALIEFLTMGVNGGDIWAWVN